VVLLIPIINVWNDISGKTKQLNSKLKTAIITLPG
jgi:hypothetical protein